MKSDTRMMIKVNSNRGDMNKTVIVLGMHRSGTSMVSGVLNILGVDIGKDLLGNHWSNPLGHFENNDFRNLNTQILKEAGGDWLNPPSREKSS